MDWPGRDRFSKLEEITQAFEITQKLHGSNSEDIEDQFQTIYQLQ